MVAVVVPFKGCQPRGGGNTAPRPCRHVMTAQKVWQKVWQKSSPAYHVHRPRARCVSTAAGVMIRLGGAQTRRVVQACSVRRLRCGLRASNRWPLPPEHCAQAKPVNSNQSAPATAQGQQPGSACPYSTGQCSTARAARSGQPGAESYHRFGVYFGIFEHAGCNPEPRRQAATGFG